MKHLSVIQKGLLVSMLTITASLFTFYSLGWSEKGNIQFINIGIFICGILWTILSANQKLSSPGVKTLFNESFKFFMVVTLVMSIYTFVFYRLNPQILQQALQENEIMIQKLGNKTPSEIA
ncbi:MAG: hypothetical protein RIR96_57, partial [Bacteroidota bacterium]